MFFLKTIQDFLKFRERQGILKDIIREKYEIYNTLRDLTDIKFFAKEISEISTQKEVKEKSLLILKEIQRIQSKGKI